MTIWKYIGCETHSLPKELRDQSKLSSDHIRQILNDMPLVEGQLEAVTVSAVTALLMTDNIIPIKIHPLNESENSLDRLRKLRKSIEDNSPTRSDFKRR